MSLSPEDVQQFIIAAKSFERASKVIERLGEPSSVSTATVTQNPGNALVIVCAVLIGMNIALSGTLAIIGLRMFDLDDKLSAIYMMAPHLNPEHPEYTEDKE